MPFRSFFKSSSIIITGGVGSVGRELVKKLTQLDVGLIRVLDNDESGLFDMEMEYKSSSANVEFYHCDITDEREMRRTFSNMDYCFHTAALKHVPSCERSPFSAIHVNINGSEVVGRVAMENRLKKVIFTSSDKAVNPTNVMGTSKLMGERLFTAMNFLRSRTTETCFSCTRFGNVLGSRGSVVPLFAAQIAAGGPITVTDERMTRFVMSLSEAAELVIESMVLAKGGELFITKMPVLRIDDLARVMRERLAPLYGHDPEAVKIDFVGSRPGEKLWEELSTDEESNRLMEGEKFLIVKPAGNTKSQHEKTYNYDQIDVRRSNKIYHSSTEPVLNDDEIWELLNVTGALSEEAVARIQTNN